MVDHRATILVWSQSQFSKSSPPQTTPIPRLFNEVRTQKKMLHLVPASLRRLKKTRPSSWCWTVFLVSCQAIIVTDISVPSPSQNTRRRKKKGLSDCRSPLFWESKQVTEITQSSVNLCTVFNITVCFHVINAHMSAEFHVLKTKKNKKNPHRISEVLGKSWCLIKVAVDGVKALKNVSKFPIKAFKEARNVKTNSSFDCYICYRAQ